MREKSQSRAWGEERREEKEGGRGSGF